MNTIIEPYYDVYAETTAVQNYKLVAQDGSTPVILFIGKYEECRSIQQNIIAEESTKGITSTHIY